MVHDVLREASEAANSIVDQSVRDVVLGQIVWVVASTGDLGVATQTTDLIRERAVRAYALAGVAFAEAKGGDVEAALQRARAIDDPAGSDFALGFIAWIQLCRGEMEAALRIAHSVTDEQRKAPILAQLAKVQADQQNRRFAYTHTFGFSFNGSDLEHFDNRCAKLVATAHAKSGNLAEALRSVESVADDAGRVYVTASVVAEVARGGDLDQALVRVLGALQKAASAEHSLMTKAVAQVMTGDVDGGFETGETISDASLRGQALVLIAKAQGEAGNIFGALDTCARAPIGPQTDRVLAEIAHAQAKAGDTLGALDTTQIIQDEKGKAVALRGIATAQTKLSHPTDALSWARNLRSPFERSYALVGIAEGLLPSHQ